MPKIPKYMDSEQLMTAKTDYLLTLYHSEFLECREIKLSSTYQAIFQKALGTKLRLLATTTCCTP